MFHEEKHSHPPAHRDAAGVTVSVRARNCAQQFDEEWYAANYPDVALSGLSPSEHYERFGRLLGRRPNPSGTPLEEAEEAACAQPALPPQPEPRPRQFVKQEGTLRGGFNLPGTTIPLVRGWLARLGDGRSRIALVQIGESHRMEVRCDGFRTDLLENRINDGRHGFELVVPIELVDGTVRSLKLIDQESGLLVAEDAIAWVQERNFQDFSGFLKHSLVSPLIYAPFREEDKRCFAVMENIADQLAARAATSSSVPLVSVIMPVHNRAATVRESIESVLAQNYRNIELILIDDGSTDGGTGILDELAERDGRVVLLRNDVCRGVSFARNRGLERARGELVCYLDSDNTWDRRYVAATVGAFLHLPDAQAVYSGQLLFRGRQPHPFAVRFGSLNRGLLENRNYIDMNCFAHTRAAIRRSGSFDENLARFVDWDFILRMAETERMYSVPVLLSHYYLDKAENTLTNAAHLLPQQNQVRTAKQQRRMNAIPETIQAANPRVGRRRTQKTRSVSIVIPSFEALTELEECMASIAGLCTAHKVQVIVVDNASGIAVQRYLEALADEGRIRYLRNPVNYGFTRAVNQGLALAGQDDDVLLLNNDATLMPDALDALSAAAYRLPECGLTVPRQVLAGGTETIVEHVPYACPEQECDVNLSMHHANVVDLPVFHHGEHAELSFAPFFCVYIRREVLDRLPQLDEAHGRHYRSDRIYCDCVRFMHGFRIYHVSSAVAYHKLQRSTKCLRSGSSGNGSDYEEICINNAWNEKLCSQLGYQVPAWDIAMRDSKRP